MSRRCFCCTQPYAAPFRKVAGKGALACCDRFRPSYLQRRAWGLPITTITPAPATILVNATLQVPIFPRRCVCLSPP